MTKLEERDWLVTSEVTPETDGWLRPFYEAAQVNSLVMPYCSECGSWLELDQRRCHVCGSRTVSWRELALTGSVHAKTLIHRREAGLVSGPVPYPVFNVKLESGQTLIMTSISAEAGRDIEIGGSVRVGFRRVGGVAVPAVAGR